ncbi:MAG: sugar phosphate isomerase/epimerase [Oscillospiraceae bacterium]|jgi:sugar phosphate isomerase/epimerase|nr:sugar phosphate isomerase/epimerase [Oscillospiraceae bacterium]
MNLSFCSLGCPNWSIEEIVSRAKTYGYGGVELRIGGKQHVDPSMSEDERAAVKALFGGGNLAIPALSGYTKFADGEDLQTQAAALRKNIGLCVSLGAPVLRTFLGGEGTLAQEGASVLKECCDYAASVGVTVCMEIHDALKSGGQAAALVRMVDSKGFAILWDLHHSVKGGDRPEETWGAVGPFIRHVHIKDARPDQSLCMIGEGVLPAAETLRLLRDKGYAGFVSFEWEKMWHPELDEPETAFPRFTEFAKDALA